MGIMAYSSLWVMQDPYYMNVRGATMSHVPSRCHSSCLSCRGPSRNTGGSLKGSLAPDISFCRVLDGQFLDPKP